MSTRARHEGRSSATSTDTGAWTAQKQIEVYLDVLFGGATEWIVEMRAWPPKGSGRRGLVQEWFGEPERALFVSRCLELASTHEVYVGVGVRREKGKGKKPDVRELDVLWADLDCGGAGGGHKRAGGFEDKEAALAAVDAMVVKPSLVVDSGGGLHVYARLDEPFVLDGAARRCCMARARRGSAPSAPRSHPRTATDCGVPNSVMRLSTLTPIFASLACAVEVLPRSASPIMRLYRYIPFSARDCWWAPDSLRH